MNGPALCPPGWSAGHGLLNNVAAGMHRGKQGKAMTRVLYAAAMIAAFAVIALLLVTPRTQHTVDTTETASIVVDD